VGRDFTLLTKVFAVGGQAKNSCSLVSCFSFAIFCDVLQHFVLLNVSPVEIREKLFLLKMSGFKRLYLGYLQA
jgi:hypothetical protein